MTNAELAMAIEDELNKELDEIGEAKSDFFAEIMLWLDDYAGDDHDYTSADITYLKCQFELGA